MEKGSLRSGNALSLGPGKLRKSKDSAAQHPSGWTSWHLSQMKDEGKRAELRVFVPKAKRGLSCAGMAREETWGADMLSRMLRA
jgi:hypothetical protein